MKNAIKKLILSLSVLGFGQMVMAQCNVTIDPTSANIICGESVDVNATGLSATPALATTFDGDSIGSGWQTSAVLIYDNPCGPSLDGTSSAWFGNVPLPRTLTTNGFDLQCGGQVCFDLDFGGDDPGSPDDCEDPDQTDEGVYFQYSVDGGFTWIDIFYFEPNSTISGPYYSWANYCYTLPAGAWSASTMFQWTQPVATSTVYDHWGIDNVIITPTDCGYHYDRDMVARSDDPPLQTVNPTTTTTYIVDYTNGIDDTCTASVVVNVEQFDVLAVSTLSNINCGDCVDLNMVLNNPPTLAGATYTYEWTPTTALVDPNSQGTQACPTDNITYTATITETTTGCVGSDDVSITVAGGGAIADFTIFPGNSGCAPFAVDFTNNSTGVSYEWDFDDGSPIDTSTDPSHVFTTMGTYNVMLVAYLPGAGCINYDTAYVTITVGNSIVPTADFSYDGECGTTVVNFTNTGTLGLNYSWDVNGTIYTTENVTHDFGTTGTYTVTLTVGDPICGTQDIISMDIDVVDNPITTIFNDPTCYLFSDGSITVNTGNNTGSEVFIINDSLGNTMNVGNSNAANNLNGGWYYLDIDLGGGCVAIDSIYLNNPDELIPSVTLTDIACNGDATGIAQVDTVYGWQGDYNQLSYFWAPNPAGIGGLGADSSYSMTAGAYVLTMTDDNGCSNTFDFTLNEPPVLTFSEIGADPAFCRQFDYQSGNGVVFAAATGGTPDYDYEWYNLQDSTATGNTTWGGLNPGDYRITVVDGNGCVLQQIITVDEVGPIAEFTMTSAEFVVGAYEGTAPVAVHFTNESEYFANPNNPNADTTFFWNFNFDNSSWVISHDINEEFDTTYTEGGTYTVCLVATNKNGCTDTTCKDIIVYDVAEFDPVNIFTPNNDGVNDVFTFEFQSRAIKTFSCVIVDRWGVVMAEFDDITDVWDGTDKGGSECKDGVYFYTYTGEEDNGTPFDGQGNITLIRAE